MAPQTMLWLSVLAVHVIYLSIVGVLADDCNIYALPELVSVRLRVDQSMRKDIFLQDHKLMIPKGFAIELYARVPGARFMLLLPNGDVLVSQMNWRRPPGTVAIIRRSEALQNGEDHPEVSTFVADLSLPHGLALTIIDSQYYIYISESNRVARYPYNYGDSTVGEFAEVVVDDLPGPYKKIDEANFKHPLKNIAIRGKDLYVALGSTSNDNPYRDVYVEPKMSAIYRYDVDGYNRTLVAEGLRNAMGLSFDPRTGNLWAVVNQRDFVKYPYRDATNKYGASIVQYMDSNPPEQFVRIVEGANYGWPFCNPVANARMKDLAYVADVDRNPDESVVRCSKMRRTDKGLSAHSAPLGLTFWTGDAAPVQFKGGAVVALHGSSEDVVKRQRDINGNKVVFFPFHDGQPGPQYTLIHGFAPDRSYAKRWGRPVATLPLPDGSLLISDDYSGSIYRLYQESAIGITCRYISAANAIVSQFGLIGLIATALAIFVL